MKVSDLITELSKMPQDADVWHLWDGALRTQINVVYLAVNGSVVTSDYDQVCYDIKSRPAGCEKDKYWSTIKDPNENDDDF